MLGAEWGTEGQHDIVAANAFGRFRLRAFPLSDGRFTVVIRRQEHVLIRLADAMRGLPLSAQQREVALLLAQGLNHREIARRLRVSVNTASYHIKQLFNKLDAHDRGEVVARILAGHTVRRS
jgi:DNA-binding NarL/FixJ family response regulator